MCSTKGDKRGMLIEGTVKGLDTILDGNKNLPMDNIVAPKVADILKTAQSEMNSLGMALIPYCGICKEPLDWTFQKDKLGFIQCPRCGRRWGSKKRLSST